MSIIDLWKTAQCTMVDVNTGEIIDDDSIARFDGALVDEVAPVLVDGVICLGVKLW